MKGRFYLMILHLVVFRGQLSVSWITGKAVSMYLPILSQCYRFYSRFVLCLTIRPLHLQEGLRGPPLLLDGALVRKNRSATKKRLLLQIIIFVLLFIIITADLLIRDQQQLGVCSLIIPVVFVEVCVSLVVMMVWLFASISKIFQCLLLILPFFPCMLPDRATSVTVLLWLLS